MKLLPTSTMRGRRGQNQRKKRISLAFDEKVKVLGAIDNGTPMREIADSFGISIGAVSSVKKDRGKFLARMQQGVNQSYKRDRKPRYPELDLKVFEFIGWMRSERLPVSGQILKCFAVNAAQKLGIHEFRASNGWLSGFLRRKSVQKSIKLYGEAAAVCSATYEANMDALRATVLEYSHDTVYNADESGLLYALIPSRSYLMSGEKRSTVRGTKLMRSKKRITMMVCTNASGTHKVPLKFIGKSQNPRCFLDFPDLKAHYSSQKNAWMDTKCFQDWLLFWYMEARSRTEDRLLLIMDNFSGHEQLPELDGVKYWFLPPGTTAVFQPMDQGVIANLKSRYRTMLISELIASLRIVFAQREMGVELPQPPAGRAGVRDGCIANVADAIRIAIRAWDTVSVQSIKGAWNKSQCLPNESRAVNQPFVQMYDDLRSLHEEILNQPITSHWYETPVVTALNEFFTNDIMDQISLFNDVLDEEQRGQDLVETNDAINMYLIFDDVRNGERNSARIEIDLEEVRAVKSSIEEVRQKMRSILHNDDMNAPIDTLLANFTRVIQEVQRDSSEIHDVESAHTQ